MIITITQEKLKWNESAPIKVSTEISEEIGEVGRLSFPVDRVHTDYAIWGKSTTHFIHVPSDYVTCTI